MKKKNSSTWTSVGLIVLILLTLILLVGHFITAYSFTDQLMNDGSRLLGGFLQALAMPCIIIAGVMQLICFILVIIGGKNNHSLDIINIIIEVLYFFLVTILVVPYMYINLLRYSLILALPIVILFEVINIIIIILMARKIIVKSKKK